MEICLWETEKEQEEGLKEWQIPMPRTHSTAIKDVNAAKCFACMTTTTQIVCQQRIFTLIRGQQ